MNIYENAKSWLRQCPALGEARLDMFGDHSVYRRCIRGQLREITVTADLHVPLADTDEALITAARTFTEADSWLRGHAPELGAGRIYCDLVSIAAPRFTAVDDRGCAVCRQEFRILYYEKGAA